ncbi:MAG: hypothetical protein WD673_05055 [Alphaproteobacteria bacterium]
MDFIFMLTRGDETVEDCLEVLESIRSVGLRHVGFKDVGVDLATLESLHGAIKATGATSYLEIVSTSAETALASTRTAARLGVDCVLGGTDADAALGVLRGRRAGYYPFPGFPSGHPTRLGGTPDDVAEHCRAFRAKGCAGADLLAYRATESDPLALVRAARQGLGDGRLVVAGSVNSPERIRALAGAGADAFTIGSAAFDGSFAPRQGALASQLRAILAACA